MYLFLVILLGLVLGSFLNVCIYRIPEQKSIAYPRSHCMTCNHALGPLDLVPVFSYLFLRGKCRYCKTKIVPRYMLVELLNTVAFVGIYLQYGASFDTVMYCTFTAFLITLTMIDFDHMILPTNIIVVGWFLGLGFICTRALLLGEVSYLWEPLLASALGYGIFYALFYGVIFLYKKEGLGFGDVRLMALLGLYTSVQFLFLIIFIASLLASFYGIAQYIKCKESKPFAFGPYLCMGAYLCVLFGSNILQWYFGLFGMAI